MKLATLKGGRDGRLVVVSRDLTRCAPAEGIAATAQAALDDWSRCGPQLTRLTERLEAGAVVGARPFDPAACAAILPRAYQWADGSAYLSHVRLVRQARGAAMPESFRSDPLIYQGGSDAMRGPCDVIPLRDPAWGLDLEGEVAVIVDDVPAGATSRDAALAIRLVTLVNDVSPRNFVPAELAKGFGFFQSKPPTAFAPVAVTPDELGAAWDGTRLHGALTCFVNGRLIGAPDAGRDMAFGFPDLIAHAARTRPLGAGSIIGSGTVSNEDPSAGASCLAEVRMREAATFGEPRTAFLTVGDTVRIEMVGADGGSIFGAIEQRVVAA